MDGTCCACCLVFVDQKSNYLQCRQCEKIVHLECLKSKYTPGDLAGDVFFHFTCSDCSDTAKEAFERKKLKWIMVIVLAIYNLSVKSQELSHNGYFHYKIHIASFVERNWHFLFLPEFKRKKMWIGTLTGLLSTYSPAIFESGFSVCKTAGWWKLSFNESPVFYYNSLNSKPQIGKKRAFNEEAADSCPNTSSPKRTKSDLERFIEGELSNENNEVPEIQADFDIADLLINEESETIGYAEDKFSGIISQSMVRSLSNESLKNEDFNSNVTNSKNQIPVPGSSDPIRDPEGIGNKLETDLPLFLPSLLNKSLSRPLPWKTQNEIITKAKNSAPISEHKEREMLSKLRNILESDPNQNVPANVRRFYRKLKIRQLKRDRLLPIFDLNFYHPTEFLPYKINTRLLDRFQVFTAFCPVKKESSFYSKLVGQVDPEPFVSPHVGRVLHPFIMRNRKTTPPWLRLMLELQIRVNKTVPERAPIDYCYVRPHHLPAVNALLQRLFWPGIDMAECLTYPEFSVVALYKKLVIGCGFLVPDVSHNEAYISFMAVRPEWQRAGIATFMLYHLVQTCVSKDITLHVSATNPAICLYQRFGFKIEEVILDFYDKYLDPIATRDGKHALFLRLKR